jgi:hypothetical protein
MVAVLAVAVVVLIRFLVRVLVHPALAVQLMQLEIIPTAV